MLNLITYTKYSKFVAVSQLLSEEKNQNSSETPPSGQHLTCATTEDKSIFRDILTISDTPDFPYLSFNSKLSLPFQAVEAAVPWGQGRVGDISQTAA